VLDSLSSKHEESRRLRKRLPLLVMQANSGIFNAAWFACRSTTGVSGTLCLTWTFK
jgi:hypothetical protein